MWTLADVYKTNKINSLMRQHPLQSLSTFLALVGERLKKAGARMGRAAAITFDQLVLACASVARLLCEKSRKSAARCEGSRVADAVKDYLTEIKAEKPGARSEVFDAWIVPNSAPSRSNSRRPIAPTGSATSWRRS
jgi:hypothetical protein